MRKVTPIHNTAKKKKTEPLKPHHPIYLIRCRLCSFANPSWVTLLLEEGALSFQHSCRLKGESTLYTLVVFFIVNMEFFLTLCVITVVL